MITFRKSLGLEPMGFLTLVKALHNRLGVSVPGLDYSRIVTAGGAVRV